MSFNANIYYKDEKITIIYSENFSNDEFIKKLNNNIYIFYQFTWNIEAIIKDFPWNIEKNINVKNNNFNCKTNLIFCAPTKETYELMIKKGYNAKLINGNAFLDYNLLLIGNKERIYDAVINSRPFWWKRVYLTNKVRNLAYIKGNDWAKNETTWDGWKDMNFSLIAENIRFDKVIEIYQQSKMGIILSGNTGENQQGLCEGSNYSTSEYLLCGLPVISTPNGGGRNIWLNDYNSIVCEPNEDSVSNSVEIMFKKIENNEIDREKIRNDQINKMDEMRQNFNNKIQEIFNIHNIYIDAKEYFKKKYYHKMVNYDININEIFL
jgi:glycosyltransferase involved in cell wall biosynthesis